MKAVVWMLRIFNNDPRASIAPTIFPKQQQNMNNNKNKETEKETERETYSSTGTFSSANIKFVKNFQMWGVRWATAFRPSPMKLEPVVAGIFDN